MSEPHPRLPTPTPDPGAVPTTYLTDDLPPVGGRIKERPEDFFVEELPLYSPSGQGEHIYLFIQKRGLSTLRVVRLLARHFGVRPADVGYAGLKDKRAVTRQLFSVHAPGRRPEDFPAIAHENITVLWADLHTNKLRRGHLAGNRFSIRVRGIDPAKVLVVRRVLARLGASGVPNRIGEQRFGYLGRNHLIGRAIILGDWPAAAEALLAPAPVPFDTQAEGRALYAKGRYLDALQAFAKESRTERTVLRALSRGATPERAFAALDPTERDFFVSAFQSAVFNAVLRRRMEDGLFSRLVAGDVAFKHDNRAVFAVDEAIASDPGTAERLARFEISPSGPMWGPAMVRASGQTDDAEREALAAFGVTPDDLARFDRRSPGALSGARRPFRVPITDADVEAGADEHGPYVRCAFDLPRGAFATSVMAEIMKPAPGAAPIPSDEEVEA